MARREISSVAREAIRQTKEAGYGYLELAMSVFDAFNPVPYPTVDAFLTAFYEAELPEEVLVASEILSGSGYQLSAPGPQGLKH
jgi:hypothetical protein